MALSKYEREILAEAKTVTGNKKLKEKHLLEWCTGVIKERAGERVDWLPLSKVWVATPVQPE